MNIFIAIFAAKLLSPIGGVVALTIGALTASRWSILIGALAGAVISEVILQLAQSIRPFDTGIFLIGMAAFTLWAGIGNLLVRRLFTKGEPS